MEYYENELKSLINQNNLLQKVSKFYHVNLIRICKPPSRHLYIAKYLEKEINKFSMPHPPPRTNPHHALHLDQEKGFQYDLYSNLESYHPELLSYNGLKHLNRDNVTEAPVELDSIDEESNFPRSQYTHTEDFLRRGPLNFGGLRDSFMTTQTHHISEDFHEYVIRKID